jgi:hypothetical protein
MWVISGNTRYADNACAIIRAWATTCTVFKGNNAPLEGGWGTDSLSRSAELLKHTYPGWTPQLEQQYVGWVRRCVMPQLHKEGLWVHLPLANWQTTIGEAKAQFAILTGEPPCRLLSPQPSASVNRCEASADSWDAIICPTLGWLACFDQSLCVLP